jgi:hypothetical protein
LGDCQIAKVSNEADICILTSSEMATFWGGEKHVRFLKVSNQHQWWNLVEIWLPFHALVLHPFWVFPVCYVWPYSHTKDQIFFLFISFMQFQGFLFLTSPIEIEKEKRTHLWIRAAID